LIWFDSLMDFLTGKCKFWKTCPKYSSSGATCNQDAGIYHGDYDHTLSCYREMEELNGAT
jgi:hypothetical protein